MHTFRPHVASSKVPCACALGLALVLIPFVSAGPATTTQGVLSWTTGQVTTPVQTPAEVAASLRANTRGGSQHVVVQFDEAVRAAQRSALSRAGVQLLSYVGDNAFFAVVDGNRIDPGAAARVGGVRCVLGIDPLWKQHPDIAFGTLPAWSVHVTKEQEVIAAAYVVFHRDVDAASAGAAMVRAHGGVVRSVVSSVNMLVVELPAENLGVLAAEDAVQWVEPPLPRLEPNNDDNRLRTGAEVVQDSPYNLDGSGVTVLVYDGGTVYSSHADFGGRAQVRDGSDASDHATHVAGTIGGSGVASGGLYRGMAPGVTIESYGFELPGLPEGFLYTDPGDLEQDYADAIGNHGAAIANNSIGTNTASNGFPCEWEGNYGVTSALIDTIIRGDGSNPLFAAPFRAVWSAGNERQTARCLGVEGFASPYHSTAPPACAKNHITVGAVYSDTDSVTTFTSFGPADDGRLKPDIVAPGCQLSADGGVTSCAGYSSYAVRCGTSMSAPTVTGICALLMQEYRRIYPGQPDPRNATLKVLLAQTAVDIEQPGPDYRSGYGSVRALAALDLLRSRNFLEHTVAQDEHYEVTVGVAPEDTELKVTLAWDDVPATPNVSPALVNDLDLRVIDPAGEVHYPWTLDPAQPDTPAVRTGPDRVNNIEQVVIAAPLPGAYRVQVVGHDVPEGPQPFSLAATPFMASCSSAGTAELDRVGYGCEATATLRVVDCDLNTSDDVVDTVTVNIASTSEPAGEDVVLSETMAESAAFLGNVPLAEVDAPGVLLVAPGDTVTLTYEDADTGRGEPATVVDTAVVDCVAPVVEDVQVAELTARSAVVAVQTSEPTSVIVPWGTDCAVLGELAFGTHTAAMHNVLITGLDDDVAYFFKVRVADVAGNIAIADNEGACFSVTTPDEPELYTELFQTDNDLAGHKLMFAPVGGVDHYVGCVEAIDALPTDPAGGQVIGLSDDDYQQVSLADGATVPLYGVHYATFYVGSNGYITFEAGDIDMTESLGEHFEQPRISALFDDFDLGWAGQVSWRQLEDRVAVTFEGVPEYGEGGDNTFQVEMFYDGRVVLSYLSVAAEDGLVGLSAGGGLSPLFRETDLTGLGECLPRPPGAVDTFASTAVGQSATVALVATDDGLPDPPGALSYTVLSLPLHAVLHDPLVGPITEVPYTLAEFGNEVLIDAAAGYWGSDEFTFQVDDGGAPPAGGPSNVAAVLLTMGGPDWDPVAHDVHVTTPTSVVVDVPLNASDPQDDPLVYTILTLPAQGQLYGASDTQIVAVPHALAAGEDTVRYHPPYDETLTATFDYEAADATWTSNAATVAVTVGGPQRAYAFSLDGDPGWSCEGDWAFGQPLGAGGAFGPPDPTAGFTGTNVYGYNLAGDYENYTPREYLTTPALDCGELVQTELRFWRWLGVEAASWDHAGIEISTDGVAWEPVWEHDGGAIGDGAWVPCVYDVSAVADRQSTVYIRWVMGATDGTVTYCGWNIDDIEIWGLPPAVPADCPGDANCDGYVTWRDIDHFVAGMNDNVAGWEALFDEPGPPCPFTNLDVSADGRVDWRDIDPFVARMGTACRANGEQRREEEVTE